MRSRRHRTEDGNHDRRRRRGGRERFFKQGELRLAMLHLLARRPGSGYDIIKALEAGTGGRYTPSAGVIYPTLTMLQDLGQITLEGGNGSRNTYRATTMGIACLSAYESTVKRLLARMEEARINQETAIPIELRAAACDLAAAIRSSLRKTGGNSVACLIGLLNDMVRRIDEIEGVN